MNGDFNRTKGEVLFEQYLAMQGLPFEFEKEHEGKTKRPDYTIEWHGKTVVLDVKDFDPLSEPFGMGVVTIDPYPRIREKINQGRDKFQKYKELCCGLVLHDPGFAFVLLDKPDVMLGAMYGDSGFLLPFNPSTGVGDSTKIEHAFLKNGKMIRPNKTTPQNTTISALITLTKIKPHFKLLSEMLRADRSLGIEGCRAELRRTVPDFDPDRVFPRVIVWHNAVARIPFPDDLFCGPYDTHFGIVMGESGDGEQCMTYRGDGLPSSVQV